MSDTPSQGCGTQRAAWPGCWESSALQGQGQPCPSNLTAAEQDCHYDPRHTAIDNWEALTPALPANFNPDPNPYLNLDLNL